MSDPGHYTLSDVQEVELRDNLKRCTPETVEAAVAFRRTGEVSFLPTIILGIISKFVEPDVRPKLDGPNDDLRILDDLGVDSLTLIEIVTMVEETLDMKIENEELANLRTIGEVKSFVATKVQA